MYTVVKINDWKDEKKDEDIRSFKKVGEAIVYVDSLEKNDSKPQFHYYIRRDEPKYTTMIYN